MRLQLLAQRGHKACATLITANCPLQTDHSLLISFSHKHHPPRFKCHIPAPPNDAIITAMGQAGVMWQFVDQICLPALGRKAYPTSSLLPEAKRISDL